MNRIQLERLEGELENNEVVYNDYTRSCPPNNTHYGIGIEDKEAMVQAIKKILLTQRGAHEIYPSNYGINLDKYIGKSHSYIRSDLQRELRVALLADDRIIDVKNFNLFSLSKDEMFCVFTVQTIYGKVKISGSLTI